MEDLDVQILKKLDEYLESYLIDAESSAIVDDVHTFTWLVQARAEHRRMMVLKDSLIPGERDRA